MAFLPVSAKSEEKIDQINRVNVEFDICSALVWPYSQIRLGYRLNDSYNLYVSYVQEGNLVYNADAIYVPNVVHFIGVGFKYYFAQGLLNPFFKLDVMKGYSNNNNVFILSLSGVADLGMGIELMDPTNRYGLVSAINLGIPMIMGSELGFKINF